MSSLPDNKFYKVSGVSCSGEDAPKFDVYTSCKSKTDSLTNSSPPVLQHFNDESRIGSYRLPIVEKIYTRPLSPFPTETVPIVSNEQATHQELNREVEEGSTNCCNIIDCYRNFATKVRNSAFIYIVQLLFSSLPVSAIVMGGLFAENCPKVEFLPVFGAVVGAIGAIFMAIWVYVTCGFRRGTPCSNRETFLFGMLFFVTMVMTIVDAVFVYSLSPSFDPASTEYCNETFYTYAFYKEIATAVAVALSAVLYMPGSRHVLCCHDCSMRAPSNAFYASF